MSLWHQAPTLEQLNGFSKNNMNAHLGIEVTSILDDALVGTMPVDHRTKQPYGILHGGASVVLAETLGSMAGGLCVDPDKHYVVGLDINANHLRSVTSGTVTGKASPIHIGRSTQVWNIEITDEQGRKVCISRLTLAVLEKPA
ncbi:MAG: hotdog fold thioesterase [Nevskiales bacterium]